MLQCCCNRIFYGSGTLPWTSIFIWKKAFIDSNWSLCLNKMQPTKLASFPFYHEAGIIKKLVALIIFCCIGKERVLDLLVLLILLNIDMFILHNF